MKPEKPKIFLIFATEVPHTYLLSKTICLIHFVLLTTEQIMTFNSDIELYKYKINYYLIDFHKMFRIFITITLFLVLSNVLTDEDTKSWLKLQEDFKNAKTFKILMQRKICGEATIDGILDYSDQDIDKMEKCDSLIDTKVFKQSSCFYYIIYLISGNK